MKINAVYSWISPTVEAMKNLLALNKPGPGPGTYTPKTVVPGQYQPVIVQCFFKGADQCSMCSDSLYGDYYKDAKKKRPLCYCLSCFRSALPTMTPYYLKTVKKHRHCKFVHKHIDVENIVYSLIPPGRVRAMNLKEKAMWNKYGEMRDSKGLPV